MNLTIMAALASLASAGCWFHSSNLITQEEEKRYRQREIAAGREIEEGGYVEIMDGKQSYELIGTLRHQGRWSRFGAYAAALAFIFQALDLYF